VKRDPVAQLLRLTCAVNVKQLRKEIWDPLQIAPVLVREHRWIELV
jgi:hypothetical protein